MLSSRIEGADAKSLREAVDKLKAQIKSGVIVLGTVTEDGKVVLVAGVTEDLTARLKAGEIVGKAAAAVGGKGGGRADFAQAGGTDASKLDAALAAVPGQVAEKLAT